MRTRARLLAYARGDGLHRHRLALGRLLGDVDAHAPVGLERAPAHREWLTLVREALGDDDSGRGALDRRGAPDARAVVAVVGGDGLAVERQLELARAAQVLRHDAQGVALVAVAVLERVRLAGV